MAQRNQLCNGVDTPNYVSMTGTPELKDDNPAGSPAVAGPAVAGGTAQYLPQANAPTMISTGKMYCADDYLLGTELLYIRGPLSLQAEYGWNFVNDAQILTSGTAGTGTPFRTTGPIQTYVFNGGYLQAAYTLTGENRVYDKKYGAMSRYYFGGQGPYENAFLVRDEDGCICAGHGALELACRYSYTDLNAGFGTHAAGTFVNGGIMQGVSLALNWYLNSNVTIMTDWVYDYRYDASETAVGSTAGAKFAGSTSGLGTEVQLSF